MKKILFIIGSLRKESFNLQMAKEVELMLKGKVEVEYLDYSDLPMMNQDLEYPVLDSVQRIRNIIESADGIWIFSPVYNFAIPGTVKNLLDWMSRSLDRNDSRGRSAIQDKVVTVSVAANGGADKMFVMYKELLEFIRTNVVEEFTETAMNPEAWVDGKLVLTDEVKQKLNVQAEKMIEALNEK